MKIIYKFLQFLEKNQLTNYSLPPLSHDEISAFERENGIQLPKMLFELYLKIGGQSGEVLNDCPYRLLPLDEIANVQNQLLGHIEKTYGKSWQSHRIADFEDNDAVQNVLYHPARIPIFQNDNDDYYCLDYAPAVGGEIRQVLAIISDPEPNNEHLFLMFGNIEECLEDILEDLESNEIATLDDFFSESRDKLEQFASELDCIRDENFQNFNEMMTFYQWQVAGHIHQHIGKSSGEFLSVLRGGADDELPIKIHYVAPDEEERPFHTFITSGMSALPMKMPSHVNPATWSRFQRAELVIFLPLEWECSHATVTQMQYHWALQWLQIIAHLPRLEKVWLVAGKVLQLRPEDKIGNTNFGGFFIAPPIHLEDRFAELNTPNGQSIHFYALVPLFREEIALERAQGIDALLDVLQKHEINAVIEEDRLNAVTGEMGKSIIK